VGADLSLINNHIGHFIPTLLLYFKLWLRGLRPLACWNCGFKSRREHRCLSFAGVACCAD